MIERQTEYFRKPETIAPSVVNDIEIKTATKDVININNIMISPPEGDLISQNIIKTGDYRKNKATRKEISHVRFEQDK